MLAGAKSIVGAHGGSISYEALLKLLGRKQLSVVCCPFLLPHN